MHRVLLREVVIDVPSERLDATCDFWAAALLARAHVLPDHPEFTSLPGSASLAYVGLQDVGATEARVHLDIESDDIEAEVARLVGLGAVEHDRQPGWVVLRDPAGLLFCVLPPEHPEFATRSKAVPDAAPAQAEKSTSLNHDSST